MISTAGSGASGLGPRFVEPTGENCLRMCRGPAVRQHLKRWTVDGVRRFVARQGRRGCPASGQTRASPRSSVTSRTGLPEGNGMKYSILELRAKATKAFFENGYTCIRLEDERKMRLGKRHSVQNIPTWRQASISSLDYTATKASTPRRSRSTSGRCATARKLAFLFCRVMLQ